MSMQGGMMGMMNNRGQAGAAIDEQLSHDEGAPRMRRRPSTTLRNRPS
jgi:hypothetical protein